jgi:hypothetical protein
VNIIPENAWNKNWIPGHIWRLSRAHGGSPQRSHAGDPASWMLQCTVMTDIAGDKKTAEMVFGIVAAVGTPVRFVTTTLEAALRQRGYEPAVLHLSSYTKAIQLETPWPPSETDDYTRISNLMKRGNELREKAGRGDILAAFAAAAISSREGVNRRARCRLPRLFCVN